MKNVSFLVLFFACFLLLGVNAYVIKKGSWEIDKNQCVIKGCPMPHTRGSVYCVRHLQETTAQVKSEVARDMQREKDVYEMAKKARENRVNEIAEGMALAMGKKRCGFPSCRNFAVGDKEFCYDHQSKLEIVRLKKELDARYDEQVRNLGTCQWTGPEGQTCHRKANPGNPYCYLHVSGSSIVVRPLGSDDKQSPPPESFKEETEQLLEGVRIGIDSYIRRFGSYPVDLIILEDNLPTCMISRYDRWGREFSYTFSSSGYTVKSPGKDGVFGTEDDLFISGK